MTPQRSVWQRIASSAATAVWPVFLASASATADTFYVHSGAGPRVADGTRQHPFPEIQQAIDKVLDHGMERVSVWVASGTYSGPIRLRNRVSLYAGHTSYWTVPDWMNRRSPSTVEPISKAVRPEHGWKALNCAMPAIERYGYRTSTT
jgi:hypothetical protein